jgi:hypothetical protein
MVSYWEERAERERRRKLEGFAAGRRSAGRQQAQSREDSAGMWRGIFESAKGLGRELAFGPERESWVPGVGEAPRLERTLRDWGLSEQEFRLAGERASEGRVGPAVGWGALAVAGAVPFVGQAGRGIVKGVTGVGRAAGAAADVARGAEVANISTPRWYPLVPASKAQEASPFPRLLDYPEVFEPRVLPNLDNVYTRNAVQKAEFGDVFWGGRSTGPVYDADLAAGRARLFHGTANEENARQILESGIRPSDVGQYGGGVYGASSLTAAIDYARPRVNLSSPRWSREAADEAARAASEDLRYVFEFVEDQSKVTDLGGRGAAQGFFLADEAIPKNNIVAVHVFQPSGIPIPSGTGEGAAWRIVDSRIFRPDLRSGLEDFGVKPAMGDVARSSAPAADVARAGETGSGLSRAGRASDISENLATEFRSGSFEYTAPAERVARAGDYQRDTVEILHRQGFDQPPAAVSRSQFDELRKSGEYIPIYRGVRDYEGIPAQKFVDEFNEGEFFIGGGALGNGAYFTTSPGLADAYRDGGQVIEALIPRNARLFDLDSLDAKQILLEKPQSFRDLSDYLAAKGYDGLITQWGAAKQSVVLYNRSAAIVPGKG